LSGALAVEGAPPSARHLLEVALSADEYAVASIALGRHLNRLELGMLGALWSEHCSYKTSRSLLRTLPTRGPQVLQGPGENAGAVDIGDGLACVFKIESHNHPSAIEPYQGAATGVGGILRDIFTMGARPVALLDSLWFGPLSDPHQRHLFDGVVAGIGGYGNCVGVPTVGGEVWFSESYSGNCLVNAMCAGIVEHARLTLARAAGTGNAVLLVGADTGRDGIHGATFASVDLDATGEDRRPAVQVGNPFLAKCLLEACMELAGHPAVVAMQDLGAAGLCGSAAEVAHRGGLRHRDRRGAGRSAGTRDVAVRGDAQRVAGADAPRGRVGQAARGAARVRPLGPSLRRRGHAHRHAGSLRSRCGPARRRAAARAPRRWCAAATTRGGAAR
jgi:phosphoribosylformylglycinamidine synthase